MLQGHTKKSQWWCQLHSITIPPSVSPCDNRNGHYYLRRLQLIKENIPTKVLYVKLTTVLFLSAASKLLLLVTRYGYVCGFYLLRLCWSLNWPFLPQKCSVSYVTVVRMLCSAGVANIGSCYFCIPLRLQHSQKIPSPLCFLNFFFSPSNVIHMGWCVQVNARTMECRLVSPPPTKPNESLVIDGEKSFHVQSWNFGFESSGIRIPH